MQRPMQCPLQRPLQCPMHRSIFLGAPEHALAPDQCAQRLGDEPRRSSCWVESECRRQQQECRRIVSKCVLSTEEFGRLVQQVAATIVYDQRHNGTPCSVPCSALCSGSCSVPCSAPYRAPYIAPCSVPCIIPCSTPCSAPCSVSCSTPCSAPCSVSCSVPCSALRSAPCSVPSGVPFFWVRPNMRQHPINVRSVWKIGPGVHI